MSFFFKSRINDCPKNKKKFLFFSWFGDHKPEYIQNSLKPWASGLWEFKWECRLCKCVEREFGVRESDLRHILTLSIALDEWKTIRSKRR